MNQNFRNWSLSNTKIGSSVFFEAMGEHELTNTEGTTIRLEALDHIKIAEAVVTS